MTGSSLRARLPWASLLVPVATGFAMAVLGPYGTFDALDLTTRLAFWVPVLCSGAWMVQGAQQLLAPSITTRVPLGWGLMPVLVSFLVWGPQTLFVQAMLAWVAGVTVSVWQLAPQVLFLLVILALPWSLADRAARRLAASQAAPPPPPAPAWPSPLPTPSPEAAPVAPPIDPPATPSAPSEERFRARLPPGFPGPILCLSAEDHYLRVITPSAETLVLCRMVDATRDLAGLGLRVHRSWWVAHSAIRAIDGDWLLLHDNRRIPIGRTFRAAVLQAIG
ncbi:MAG: LytTR family DNA-binding domain-containing protein [Alphaproteobacteria bacterium]|nr:LytTR family DNA-binding domain-containing protein [Alphaproteobacteria bacterium]